MIDRYGRGVLLGLAVAAWTLASGEASAQRVRFPGGVQAKPLAASQTAQSIYQQPGASGAAASTATSPWSPAGTLPTSPAAPAAGAGTTLSAPATTGAGATPAPSASTTPSPWLPPNPAIAPSSPSPGVPSMNYPPGSTPYYGPAGPSTPPAPGAVYQGLGPPPNSWDPYATPGEQASLFPQNPVFPSTGDDSWPTKIVKFRQAVGVDYTFIAGNGGDELGLNDFQFYGTFAFPFLYNPETPLLVTPGFGLQLWSGPISTVADDSPDMPPTTFDGYIQAAWNPQLNQIVGGELAFAVGVHSDFKKITGDSFRYTGHGYLTLALSPNWRVKGGIIYLDRVRVSLLPAGGATWVSSTIDPKIQLDLLFPNPRLTIRLADRGNTHWWWYVRGDYGGGSWYIERTTGILAGEHERVDYNDIRIATGFEFEGWRGLQGSMEIGVATARELVYERGLTDNVKPNTQLLVGATLAF